MIQSGKNAGIENFSALNCRNDKFTFTVLWSFSIDLAQYMYWEQNCLSKLANPAVRFLLILVCRALDKREYLIIIFSSTVFEENVEIL